jgi:pyruvate/2-oxoglutarate dehydrogenase complex dihydrolipoamide dehydrogenase (E3) component
VLDVDAEKVKIPGGSKVVVCGGGLSGTESALSLAMAGCEVKVVDMLPQESFAQGGHIIARNALMHLLGEHKVELIDEHLVRAIEGNKVQIEGKDWSYRSLEADYVVKAFGVKSDEETNARFKELIPDVYSIGDADKVSNILHANHTAFDRAMNL